MRTYGAEADTQFTIFDLPVLKKQCLIFEKIDDTFSCSWRYAGGLIAQIRSKGENYLDFYCSGNEGKVSEEIKKDLNEMGWKHFQY